MNEPDAGRELPGEAPRRQQEGIAIIGMSCLFPSAPDVDAYWRNILGKVDAISDPPPESWDAAASYDPDSDEADRIYCKRGGYLGDLARFDALANGVPPLAVGGEPDHWLALQIARDALADAGYADLDQRTSHRTAIVLGRGGYPNAGTAHLSQRTHAITQTLDALKTLRPELTDADLEALRDGLKSSLPPFAADTMASLVPNLIVGRIANRLDLMGPSYTVDAACASSLIAVQIAVRDLLDGACDLALAGGSQVWDPMPMLSVFCRLGALSRGQEIRPFDKDADGTILGQGLGMLVLKRLSDAERDADRIYAVIRGVGVASDGRAVGVMAPRVEGEELAMLRAYEAAGISPTSIQLIEAHGTGTPVGDGVEIQALSRVFGPREGELPSIALGSVKSMISHTIPAAGAAGMIKTALALHHKVLPPTLKCAEPNPKFELEKTRLYINTETRPWISGAEEPRRAAVSAFGFGGINAHVVLEEYRPRTASQVAPGEPQSPPEEHRPPWDSEVCVITGETPEALIEKAARLRAFVSNRLEHAASKESVSFRLQDISYSLSVELRAAPAAAGLRLAIVATSLADLVSKLDRALEKLAQPDCKLIREAAGIYYAAEPLAREGKLAFLFPGEGSQYANMLADLCLQFPEVRACFDRIDRLYIDHGRAHVPSDFIFPRPTFSAAEAEWAEKQLWDMDGAVAAVLAADEALQTILDGLGVRPDVLLGHSSGEWTALRAAGVFAASEDTRRPWIPRELLSAWEDTIALDDIPSAALLAIGADRVQVAQIVSEVGSDARIAMDNCPHQVVVAVTPSAAEQVMSAAGQEGFIAERLAFDRPYHTPLFAPYSRRLPIALEGVDLRPPSIPVYSCATSGLFPDDAAGISSLAADQWINLVEFRRTIEMMHEQGVRLFVEVGPKSSLTSFVEDTLRRKPFCAVAANVQRRSGLSQINHLAGTLAAHGVDLDLAYFYKWRNPRIVDWRDTAAAPAAAPRGVLLATSAPEMHIPAALAERLRASAGAASPAAEAPPPQSVPAGPASSVPADEAAAAASPLPGPAPAEAALAPAEPALPVDAPDAADAALAPLTHAFLQTMEQFLGVQERVLHNYLQGEAPLPGTLETPPLPSSFEPSHVAFVPPPPVESPPLTPLASIDRQSAALEHPAVGVAEVPAPGREAFAALLLEIVSDRTGYPAEAISPNADLEADLGIDSIKRVEIIGTFVQRAPALKGIDIEQLTTRRTLNELIDFATGVTAGPGPEPDAAAAGGLAYPLLGTISLQTDTELVARRRFEVDRDLYLLDHVIGRDQSVFDPELRGLPIMPLTMSLEVLAEAAAALVPDRVITGLRDVRANRWLAFDAGALDVEITARRDDAEPGRVNVRLRNLTEDDASGLAAVEAVVLLADAYAAVPPSSQPELEGAKASVLPPGKLYRDVMFHGPAWQGVSAIDAVGGNGSRAVLTVLPSDSLLRDEPAPRFVLDPLTLDAAGQVLGFWTFEQLADGQLVFPFHVDSLDVYGPNRGAGEALHCALSITHLDERQVRADIDVLDGEGQLWLRLEGWTDKRFYLSFGLRPVGLQPLGFDAVTASLPELVEPLDDGSFFECRRFELEATPDTGFIARLWAMRILSREERAQLAALSFDAAPQMRWLAGRQAAKEAVLGLLTRHFGLDLWPADVEICSNERGALFAIGALGTPLPCRFAIAVSEGTGGSVAVARLVPDDAPPLRLGLALTPPGDAAAVPASELDASVVASCIAGALAAASGLPSEALPPLPAVADGNVTTIEWSGEGDSGTAAALQIVCKRYDWGLTAVACWQGAIE